jgi:hypothetical protein
MVEGNFHSLEREILSTLEEKTELLIWQVWTVTEFEFVVFSSRCIWV